MMHVPYEVEKEIKENKVKNTLRLDNSVKFNGMIINDNQYGYRNKIMMPFQRIKEDEGHDTIYGFYEKRSHKFIPMDNCVISSDVDNQIMHLIARYLNIFHVSIYDEGSHTGVFREVMIRHTALNEYMIVFVCTKEIDLSGLVELLIKEFDCIKSIYLNLNPAKTNVVLAYDYKLLFGNETITEDILGLKFNVSAGSFMQVNHDQCEKLYKEALRMANLDKNMNAIDAYCGMGSITLNIAQKVNHVTGIEIVDAAIVNANRNKALNGITNADFICGKCEEEIKKLVNKEKIDVIFVDPPRKGCEESFLATVVEMNIPRIVYVSCNVATLARDIDYLKKNGYELKEVTPVDLFSKTAHVECVCLLERRKDR